MVAQTTEMPTVWVVGDSTASNVNHRGWADPFADYFDPAKATTVNRARAGRLSSSGRGPRDVLRVATIQTRAIAVE